MLGSVREANYIFVNVKIEFRYMDSDMFSKLYTTYIQPKLEYASAV